MIWILAACSSSTEPAPEAPRPKLRVSAPAKQVVKPPVAPPAPTLDARPGLTVDQVATGWDQARAPCEGCEPLKLRVQASTERVVGELVMAAEAAMDGNPTTGWCGIEGIGDQLSLAAGAPFDLRRITFAGWTGEGPAITEVLVTTDRSDRFVLALPAARGTKWPDGGEPPTLDVELTGVQHVQFEVREASGRGMPCVAEVALEGVRRP